MTNEYNPDGKEIRFIDSQAGIQTMKIVVAVSVKVGSWYIQIPTYLIFGDASLLQNAVNIQF